MQASDARTEIAKLQASLAQREGQVKGLESDLQVGWSDPLVGRIRWSLSLFCILNHSHL